MTRCDCPWGDEGDVYWQNLVHAVLTEEINKPRDRHLPAWRSVVNIDHLALAESACRHLAKHGGTDEFDFDGAAAAVHLSGHLMDALAQMSVGLIRLLMEHDGVTDPDEQASEWRVLLTNWNRQFLT